MAELMIFSVILFAGLVLAATGTVLLFARKSKLAGGIVLGVGLLTIVFSTLAFLSLVIVTRTIG